MRTLMQAAAIVLTAIGVLGAAALRAQGQDGPSLLPPGEPGTPLVVEGRILGPSGPVPRAALYVYQTDARGYYSSEIDDDNRNPRLKARFATDDAGRFRFRTIMPGPYPRSGPPAHIHVEVTPAGQETAQFELVFEGDSRLTDRIRADAKAGRFFAICAPATGSGGEKSCSDVTFRVR